MDVPLSKIILFSAASFLFILISGVFILFDSALNKCRKTRLEKEKHKRYQNVLKILDNTPDSFKWAGNLSLACRLWSSILKVISILVSAVLITMLFVDIIFSNSSRILLSTVLYALIMGILITLLGDALPKLISRINPEKITAALLPFMKILAVPMMPFTLPSLKFKSFFKNTFKDNIDDSITEDELRDALIEGEKSGIVESKERTMVEGVFYLGDRTVGAFMTHRSEIEWLDINTSYNEIKEKALLHRSQRCFPVVDGNPDQIAGAVYLEDIILDLSQPKPQGLRAIMKKAQFVPETMTALKSFESFKEGQVDFLFVMDEYGGLAGIISIRALVEEIVGELSAPVAHEEPIIRQEDGSWLADGTLNIDDALQALSLTRHDEEGDFHTLAGLILNLAGELPSVGDSFEYQGYKFIVVDKDGNRIDKLMIKKIEN
ncbi:MAG: hemolysin family protein [Treponema sp.]|nr:hemolysin family protein [Treponema sp.]MCL2250561.1 hemolysin family protein [Treponema sp.]